MDIETKVGLSDLLVILSGVSVKGPYRFLVVQKAWANNSAVLAALKADGVQEVIVKSKAPLAKG